MLSVSANVQNGHQMQICVCINVLTLSSNLIGLCIISDLKLRNSFLATIISEVQHGSKIIAQEFSHSSLNLANLNPYVSISDLNLVLEFPDRVHVSSHHLLNHCLVPLVFCG